MKRNLKKVTSKILLLSMLIIICSIFMPLKAFTAKAMELNNDECDVVFLETIQELAKENYLGQIAISATKEIIYDIDLNPMGFVYDFSVNGENGYAIVLNTNGRYEISELYFNSENPFNNLDEAQRIYVSNLIYLYQKDGEYFFIGNEDINLNDNQVNQLREMALYSGGGTFTYSSETITYISKTQNKYLMVQRHPGISGISGYNNSCAPVAGANIIQFWDRYKTNLIGNYTPGTTVGTAYLYKNPSTTTDTLIGQLYTDMGTNSNGNGTSVAQFQSGISTYSTRYNYTASYSTCMSSGVFSYSLAQQYIAAGNPIALFLDTYNISEIVNSGNTDTVSYMLSTGTHAMAGFGYNEITYSLSGGTTRIDKYIAVATGVSEKDKAYLNINYNVQIDDAFAVVVA